MKDYEFDLILRVGGCSVSVEKDSDLTETLRQIIGEHDDISINKVLTLTPSRVYLEYVDVHRKTDN